MAEVSTPGVTAADEVAAFLRVNVASLMKTLIYRVTGGPRDGAVVAVCVRGDDQLQETKLLRVLEADAVEMASDADISGVGGVSGFVGPLGLDCEVVVDRSLKAATGLVAGANRPDTHLVGLDMERDLPGVCFADVREARPGDACVKCGGRMTLSRGIEVGHVFELGRVYAEPMGVAFQDEQGRRAVATMGCYGIGISRLLAAVVEQCHDDLGIIWPVHLAPFHVVLISIGDSADVQSASRQIYDTLNGQGIEVLWDERRERPGVKFRDAELMGFPVRLVVGERGLADGVVEFKTRAGDAGRIAPADTLAYVEQLIRCH